MRVLVTGAGGFLGAAVAVASRAAGFDVVTTGRRPGSVDVACDISDFAALWRVLNDVRPAAIINCAAMVNFSEDCLAALYSVNCLAPGLLASWALQHEAYVLQVSSVAVHGVRATFINQSAPIAPDTDYGRSKLIADDLIGASSCNAAVVRIGGIFGARGPEHLGLNRAIRSARRGEPPSLVGKGAARRNYIHVDDAARALVDCMQRRRCGLFYLGGSEVLMIREMLQSICAVYCPNRPLVRIKGAEAGDQVVESSSEMMVGRSFAEALGGEA